jgi:hypothetical protein
MAADLRPYISDERQTAIENPGFRQHGFAGTKLLRSLLFSMANISQL